MAGKTVVIFGGGIGGPAMACRKAVGGVSVIQTFERCDQLWVRQDSRRGQEFVLASGCPMSTIQNRLADNPGRVGRLRVVASTEMRESMLFLKEEKEHG